MKSKGFYHYYVEGPDDEIIVNTLKTELQLIIPGKVERFNVVQNKLVKRVICITQVMNLEEELVRSCKIRSVLDITKSKSQKDYKHDLLRIANLDKRLRECGFDITKFWAKQPDNQYRDITNRAEEIKY